MCEPRLRPTTFLRVAGSAPSAHTDTGAFPGGVVKGLLAAGCWPRCPFARFAFLRSPKTAMTVTVAGVVWFNWHWHWHWHWHWQLGSLAVARAPFPLALRGPPPGISGLADEWLPSSADTLASRTTHHRALSQLEGATWRASHPHTLHCSLSVPSIGQGARPPTMADVERCGERAAKPSA